MYKSDVDKDINNVDQDNIDQINDEKIARFVVVSNKSVSIMICRASFALLIFITLSLVEFFLVYNLTLQTNSITSNFRNLKNLQNRINNVYSMSYETVARKVNTLYINGHDTYTDEKDFLLEDLRLVEIFNGGDPSYQFSDYLDKFNSIMYTDVCNNYIKAYNIYDGVCSLELYNSGLITIMNYILDNTRNWIQQIGTSTDKNLTRYSILTSQLSDDLYESVNLAVDALNYTTIIYQQGATDFSNYISTLTQVFLIGQTFY